MIAMTASAPIDWPTGGFEWTDTLRAQLPIMRGVRVPQLNLPDNLLTEIPDFSIHHPDGTLSRWARLAYAGLVPSNMAWSNAEAQQKVQGLALSVRGPNLPNQPAQSRVSDPKYDFAFWRELVLQCAARTSEHLPSPDFITWAIQVVHLSNALPFAIRLMLEIGSHCPPLFTKAHQFLRHAIAAASDEDYRLALEVAVEFRGRNQPLNRLISYLFPEQGKWADECVAALPPSSPLPEPGWLNETALSLENARRYADRPMLLLMIHLHDQDAWPLLEDELKAAYREKRATKTLGLICQMHVPALIPGLAAHVDHPDFRIALEKLAAKWPAAVLKTVMDRPGTSRSRSLETWTAGLAARWPHGLETVLAAATDTERERYARAFAFLAPPPEEVPADLLPEVLRGPLSPEESAVLLPGFFRAGDFRRPRLADGRALPVPAIKRLGRWLALSTLSEPRPELAEVKAACTPESLAEFAWDVFEAWQAAGNPTKALWGLAALGLLGDGSTARRLVPKIQEWRKKQIHLRANLGLDILVAMGTDAALMQLHGISHKPQFKSLRDKAQRRIDQIAAARGLSLDELADRMVPDLGLDERGGLVLDFGPRQFRVGFDETLKPFVCNAEGVRLKDLPKPNKRDDEAKAPAAVARYKELKKDAKSIAALQIARLEHSMCARRRWPVDEFKTLILNHPLLCHLARRLVWGVYRDGGLADAFRVAEDLSLADRHDDAFALPDRAEVGIAHALEWPDDLARDFGQIFGDYEITQPFKQLGRETYAPTDEERRTGVIERFKGKKVATGSMLGLIGQGWEKGEEDGGYVWSLVKGLPDGWEAELSVDPGFHLGAPAEQPAQTVTRIAVRRQGFRRSGPPASLAELDPVLVSELIRDADLLAAVNP
jgi:hypothetical protein